MRTASYAKKSLLIVAIILVSLSGAIPLLSEHANAASFTTGEGYYLGSGSAKSISGLGFQPTFVIITSSTAGAAVFKTSAMASNATAFFSATADNTATSITFDSDGFTVGTLANVNSANVIYRWIAFSGSDCTSGGYMCIGSYTGNGAASRQISTGFLPEMVMVKRSTAVGAHYRTASMTSNRTEFFTSTAANTSGAYVASMTGSSFTVGTTDNTNGGVYYYIAFRSGDNNFAQGTYTGNGSDARIISGVGFQPNMVLIKNSTSTTANSRRSVISGDKHFGDLASYVADAVADATNMIQSMEPDGFEVGTGANTNQNGATMYWFAFGGAPAMSGSGSFNMAQGTYTGTGATRSISGVGFSPDLILIKDNAANYAVFRIRQMVGDSTAYLAAATADFTGGVTSLNSDGFSLGTSAVVNSNGRTYQWQAFGNAYNPEDNSGSSDFATGVYYGNGLDNRDISDMPFSPDLVVSKRNNTTAAVFRTSAASGDLTSSFAATAESADMIQTLSGNGFQIGANAAVNTSASLYRWFAFKSGTNFAVGSYTGTGVNGLQVPAPFWSDLIWVKRSTNVGGVQRPSTLTGSNSQYFMNTANASSGFFNDINASGFTVGTNAAVNASGGIYRYVTWRIPPVGTLSADIVDGSGVSVSSPSIGFGGLSVSYDCVENTAVLGSSTQKIRVTNMTANGSWSLSIAPTAGPTALWNSSSNTEHFDFNDNAGDPVGCDDGSDSDAYGGKLRIGPSGATITAQTGCVSSNVVGGSDSDFSEGVRDSIPIVTAVGGNTECYWDITDISLKQMIPKEQSPESYTLGLTLTLVAQ